MANAYLIIDAIIVAALFVLSIAVLVQNRKAQLNRIFAFFVVSVAIWITANYISNDTSNSPEIATIANYFVFAFSYFAALSLLYFSIILTQDKKAKKYIKRFTLPAIILGLFFFSPLTVAGVELQGDIYAVQFGPLIIVYAIALIGVFVAMFSVIIRNRKTSTGIQLARLNSLYYSAVLSVPLLLLLQFIIPATTGWFGLTNIGITSMLIMVFGLYYGVLKHQLLNLRLIVVRSLAYGLSVVLLSAIYGVTSYYVGTLLPSLSDNLIYIELINILFIVVIVSIYGPLLKFFKKITDKLFYRDAYDPQEVLNGVNAVLVNTVKLEQLLEKTVAIIQTQLRIGYVDFYINQNKTVKSFKNKKSDEELGGQGTEILIKYLQVSDKKITESTDEELEKNIIEDMRQLKLDCAIKMTSNGQFVGFLMAGERKSGNALTSEDVQLLEIIADEVAIAVQNSLRFEEISAFNVTLQKKIDDATSQLKRSNEKLKALDEAKDDFVSMASHQLRTPLTSVKGYLSMVLEGDAGELNEQQRSMLDQAFTSSQRMTYLIADLLNLSRLKTGKFVIENNPTNLARVITQELSQVEATAEARKLMIVYKEPETFPTLMLDETKIRQVIMNFVDNAIYYTPGGGDITVKLEELEKSIEFTVNDTGIGVPAADQHNLFSKFYRAANAKQARPDGTGLGLFMARKVIVAQGGATIFKSQAGKGSTFGFSFPKTLVTDESPKTT